MEQQIAASTSPTGEVLVPQTGIESEWWEWYFGPEEKLGLSPYKERRQQADVKFKQLWRFFGNSQYGIKKFLQGLASRIRHNQFNSEHEEFFKQIVSLLIRDFEPSTIEFILRYGKFYFNRKIRRPASEPVKGQCFLNTRYWMGSVNHFQKKKLCRRREKKFWRENPAHYVEGISFDHRLIPLQHAWGTLGESGNITIDRTLYVRGSWRIYIGIPFSQEEMFRLAKIRDPGTKSPQQRKMASLFHKEVFTPAVRQYVLWLMRQRKYVRRQMFGRKQFKKKRGKKNQ